MKAFDSPTANGIRVLLVDDEPGIVELGKEILEREIADLTVETATGAAEALEQFGERDYDGIISDYQMPGIDGLEFLEIVREERDSDVPFIIFTGKGREEVAIEALNLGADQYVRKGGDPQSPYEVLAQALLQAVIHEKTRKEKAKIEAELSSLVNGSTDPIFMVDPDCRFVFVNEAEMAAHAMEREEMIGSMFQELHPREDAEIFEEHVEAALETGDPQRQVIDHVETGEYYDRTFSPIENPDTGALERVAVLSKNITERKEMEAELKRYAKIVEELTDPVMIKDRQGRYVLANEAVTEYVPYSIDEITGMTDIDLFGEELGTTIWEREKTVLETESLETYEEQIPTEQGERTFKTTRIPYYDNEGELAGVLGICRDITELKETNEDLHQYKLAVEASMGQIAVIDRDYTYLLINEAFREAHGWAREEIIGKCVPDVLGEEVFERRIKPKLDRSLQGETVEYEMTIDHMGRGEGHFHVLFYPMEQDGEIRGVVSELRDITDRKQAEEREQFIHSLLRHDVRNKAQTMQGYLDLLENIDLPEEATSHIHNARSGVEEALSIIDRVSDLKRAQEDDIRPVRIDSVLTEVVEQVAVDDVEIDLECEHEGTAVRAGTLLDQVFSNLLENAIQHSEGSQIRIRSEATEEELVCRVEDDGRGIPEENRADIFTRGYTTDDEHGTGLGLFLVKTLLDRYGGDIEVMDSELGGAAFEVHLQKA